MATKFLCLLFCLLGLQAQAQIPYLESKRMQALTATSVFDETRTIDGGDELLQKTGTAETFESFLYQMVVKELEVTVVKTRVHLTQYMDDGGHIRKIEVRMYFSGQSAKLKGKCTMQTLCSYYFTPMGELHFIDVVTHSITPDKKDEDRGYFVYNIEDGTILKEMRNENDIQLNDENKAIYSAFHKGAKAYRLKE